MKQRRRADQMQLQPGLFDEPRPNHDPCLLEVPADRSLELQTAVGELLLKATGKNESRRGGGRDA